MCKVSAQLGCGVAPSCLSQLLALGTRLRYMGLRVLVVLTFLSGGGILSFGNEEIQGAGVAPRAAKAATEVQGLRPEDVHWISEQKEAQAFEKSGLDISQASFISTRSDSFSSTLPFKHDVALSSMQGQQFGKRIALSGLPLPLGHSVAETKEAIAQQKRTQAALQRSFEFQRSAIRGRRLASFPIQSSMGANNACRQGDSQEDGDERWSWCRGHRPSISASTHSSHREWIVSGGGEGFGASTWTAQHRNRAYGNYDPTAGAAYCSSGSYGSIQSSYAQSFEQVEQTQISGGKCAKEDSRPRQGMGSLCGVNTTEGATTCTYVSRVQGRIDGAVQRQDGRTAVVETGGECGIDEYAEHSRDCPSYSTHAGCGSAATSALKGNRCGRSSGCSRFDRRPGRGGVHGRCHDFSRGWDQRHSQSWEAFQRVNITDESCESTSQSQSQGQGQRLGRVIDAAPCMDSEAQWQKLIPEVSFACSFPTGNEKAEVFGCDGCLNADQRHYAVVTLEDADTILEQPTWWRCNKSKAILVRAPGHYGLYDQDMLTEKPSHNNFLEYEPQHFAGGASRTKFHSQCGELVTKRCKEAGTHNSSVRTLAYLRNCGEGNSGLSKFQGEPISLFREQQQQLTEQLDFVHGRLPSWVEHCFHDFLLKEKPAQKGHVAYSESGELSDEFDSNMCSEVCPCRSCGEGNLDLSKLCGEGWGEDNSDLSWPDAQVHADEQSQHGQDDHRLRKEEPTRIRSNSWGLPNRTKKVSFSDRIHVIGYAEGLAVEEIISARQSEQCFRTLWHLHGQIAPFSAWPQVLTAYRNACLAPPSGQPERPCSQEVSSFTLSFGSKDLIEDLMLRVDSAVHTPFFIDSWFLAEGRFTMCIRPRKVKVWPGMDLQHFVLRCREAWSELDNGNTIEVTFVKGATRLPAIIAHVLVVQDRTINSKAGLVSCHSLPPLMSTRAVLFPNQCRVESIFVILQHEDACRRRDARCFISVEDDGATQIFQDNDVLEVDHGAFMTGGFRLLQQFDDEQEGSISETSTEVPQSDSDVEEYGDGVSFMSSSPLTFQFEHPDPYPWQVEGFVEIEDEEEEPLSIGFADTHDDLTHAHVDQVLETVTESEEAWALITFGLGLVDLGRRDSEFSPWRMHELPRIVFELWKDHAQYGELRMYFVTPQPSDLRGARSLVLLVVVEGPDDLNQEVRNVLVSEQGDVSACLRPTYYGAKIFTDITIRDALVQLDLHKKCKPFTMRACMIRLGFTVMERDQVYAVGNGQQCNVRIQERPVEVIQAMELVAHVEWFYLQVEEVQQMQEEIHQVICHVHGITPGNRPMGFRTLILEGDDLLNLRWIQLMRQLWPFDSTHATVVFCPMATDDTREADEIVFHFIVQYGSQYGTPVLFQQQMVAADDLPNDPQGMQELWARAINTVEITSDVVNELEGRPFWIDFARGNNMRAQVSVNGQRVTGVSGEFQHGDVIRVKLQVASKRHMLTVLLSEDVEHEGPLDLEHTSFLQRGVSIKSHKHRTNGKIIQGFAELCEVLRSDGSAKPYGSDKELPELFDLTLDEGQDDKQQCECDESEVETLRTAITACTQQPWEGLNNDFALLPGLHPFVQVALQITHTGDEGTNVFHIFTDGSCKHEVAAWAFVIICEGGTKEHRKFFRVGYAAGRVQNDIGLAEQTAQDAEATALIAAADYLLSRKELAEISVHFHFDAMAVGKGSIGQTNVIRQSAEVSTRQKDARIMLSLIQRRAHRHEGIHVHAHEGHPWNEFVDSVAGMVRKGWNPQRTAILRCGQILRHPLADWAWMMMSPDLEIPSLGDVLCNALPDEYQGQPDRILVDGVPTAEGKEVRNVLKVATINVGTLEQDQVVPGATVTCKTHEILQQCLDEGIMVVGVQEGRARLSRTVQHGPFTCFIGASESGHGGVELWMNGQEIEKAFGVTFDTAQDVCIWHVTNRILVARCHVGDVTLEFFVGYAPQKGRPVHEILAWWEEVQSVLQRMDQSSVKILLGDFNCKIGSITTEGIGSAGSDVEDAGGAKLRQCCNEFQLAIPSTWGSIHTGDHWTFCSSNGARSRIDFIAVSMEVMAAARASYVHEGIDVMNGDRDHRVLVLELGLVIHPADQLLKKRRPLYNRQAARSAKHKTHNCMLSNLPLCSWQQDVNKHWSRIRDHMQLAAARDFPLEKRQQRQLYFSAEAWSLVCQRKDLRQAHRQVQRGHNMEALRLIFKTWRKGTAVDVDVQDWERLAHLRCMQEALILEQRCACDRAFRRLKKNDWKQWVVDQMDHKILQLKEHNAGEVYRILKPKKMIDKKKGRHKPLSGLQDKHGNWCSSRKEIAAAWENQFAEIELAEKIEFGELLKRSVARCRQLTASELRNIPSLFDLEKSLMALQECKATGVDGLGAELWRNDVAQMAMRLYPLLLKSAVRQQSIPELSGGWLLPLWKGKGSPAQMEGYRAILLEPTVARAFSKAWRGKLVSGLERIAAPLQYGGRAGLGITPLHMMLHLWQSNAAATKASLGLIFVDIKSAFYRVVKPMLAAFDGSTESLVHIFKALGLPSSAYEQFVMNVGDADLIRRSTRSDVISGQVASNIANTWFLVPNAQGIRAPRTGSRPGDPSADILFGFVMSQILHGIADRVKECGISLSQETPDGLTSSYVAWVDDLAVAVQEKAEKIVVATAQVLSIIVDVMAEHGLNVSCGKAKTAVMFEFRGKEAVKHRQLFETRNPTDLTVLSEHFGALQIPVVGHYKHLGGLVVPYGSKMQEIKARKEVMRQKLVPLKSVLANKEIDLGKRKMLVRSFGLSVIKLHCGAWFDLTQAETESWHATVHGAYSMLEGRNVDGEVPHKTMYQLACQMTAPMPMEMLYLERLRLLVHLLQINDRFIIASILQNHRLAGKGSWLYGVVKSLQWAQSQIGREAIPDELLNLEDQHTWKIFQEVTNDLKCSLRKVEKTHILRLKTYCGLEAQGEFMTSLCREMGWIKVLPEVEEVRDEHVHCVECGKLFQTNAALATHEQKVHHRRIALRRVVTDGVCRACQKFFHTRARLLTHLHWGNGRCWRYHLRKFVPMNNEETAAHDEQDRRAGTALHQSHGLMDHAKRSWRWASEDELRPSLPTRDFEGDPFMEPSDEELEQWRALGLLPPGRGGRERTCRVETAWEIENVCRDTTRLEHRFKREADQWEPNFDWVPPPLADGCLYFLFFSGHRRFGDISSWMHWDGRVVPVAIDLAVSKEHGNVMEDTLWIRLIHARRVVGAHGGPPCETYSEARWLDIPGQACPQPLRDQSMPWGRCFLSYPELLQCHVGSILMWATLKLLLLVYAFGGSISLEHPRGAWNDEQKWCVWMSGFVRWILRGPQLQTLTFLQGPLGQCAPKPTTMLLGRMGSFALKIFGRYQAGWRPTMTLGGKDQFGWKMARAKVYPVLLSQTIAECHLEHFESVQQAGEEPLPDGIGPALDVLSAVHDPYNFEHFQQMASDFHKGAVDVI